MSFEITGRLLEKTGTVQVSDRFKKREFVIVKTESGSGMEFTDYIKFQLTQDKCALIDKFNPNDEIKISFNIRGNKWERDGKVNYFTNLDAWRIEPINPQASFDNAPPPTIDDMPPEGGADDLPF